MKHTFFLLCIFLLLPALLRAEDNIKFGTIDLQKVLNESEAGKKAKSDLDALVKSKESIINEKSKEIEKLKNELAKQSSVLSEDARKKKEDELEKLLRDYQRTVQDSQAEVKKKENELTEAILKEIHKIIERIGKEEGYTLIIEKTIALYSNEKIDLTNRIIKEYNKSK